MPMIEFQKKSYFMSDGETLLQGLERQAVDLPCGCRSGICQSCKMVALAGQVPTEAQQGLSPAQIERREFLACRCVPSGDMHVALASEDGVRTEARIIDKTLLSTRVMRVRLRVDGVYRYRAGQFLNLRRPDGLQRSYSIASVPNLDDFLELHVARMGRMSGWIIDEAAIQSTLEISSPLGECYYREGDPDQPLLLIGTGTGLAPLFGIVREALRSGHRGMIHLYQGSGTTDGIYLAEALAALARAHANFRYRPCVSRGQPPVEYLAARAHQAALSELGVLKGTRVYLCGNPGMVSEAQRGVFLAGAALGEIHTDPFEWSVPNAEPQVA